MVEIGASDYIRALRATCGMDERERLMHSAPVERAREYLLSIDQPVKRDLSYADTLDAKTAILVQRIARALSALGIELTPMPTIALLPIADFNAYATVAPNGEPICIIDSDLTSTLLHFSWSLAEATTRSPASSVEPDLVKCCLRTIAACEELVYGGWEPARNYLRTTDFSVDESWFMFGVFLARAIETFILSHEFAHHIKGHVAPLMSGVLQANGAKHGVAFYNRSQLQEFEADRLGAEIFVATASEMFSAHFMCAPLVFFEYLTFAERFVIRERPSVTHPPASDRRVALETYLLNVLPPEAKAYYEATHRFWPLAAKVKNSFTSTG